MLSYKQNLHTHTIYCDGKNTPGEMVEKAIELGFDTIGFSGHSNTVFDIDWHMTPENNQRYIEEIKGLKAEYQDRISVLLGLEYEMYSDTPSEGYDYVIGSMHFMKTPEGIFSFDERGDVVREFIDHHFAGDGMAFAKEYYAQLATLPQYGKFDFVGHFDLITKHNKNFCFFDTEKKEYRDAALTCLHALAEKQQVFEVNTGAIARGYRTIPYPAPFILKEMKNLGLTVILTSDCHNRDMLDCHYKESMELIKACGFDSVGVMRNGKFVEEKIG